MNTHWGPLNLIWAFIFVHADFHVWPRITMITTIYKDLPWSMVYIVLPWSTMVCHDLQWSATICNDPPWSTKACHSRQSVAMVDFDSSWSTIVCHDPQRFAMVYNDFTMVYNDSFWGSRGNPGGYVSEWPLRGIRKPLGATGPNVDQLKLINVESCLGILLCWLLLLFVETKRCRLKSGKSTRHRAATNPKTIPARNPTNRVLDGLGSEKRKLRFQMFRPRHPSPKDKAPRSLGTWSDTPSDLTWLTGFDLARADLTWLGLRQLDFAWHDLVRLHSTWLDTTWFESTDLQ